MATIDQFARFWGNLEMMKCAYLRIKIYIKFYIKYISMLQLSAQLA